MSRKDLNLSLPRKKQKKKQIRILASSIKLHGGQRIVERPIPIHKQQWLLLTNVEACKCLAAHKKHWVLRRKNFICSLSHASGFTFIWDSLRRGVRAPTVTFTCMVTFLYTHSACSLWAGLTCGGVNWFFIRQLFSESKRNWRKMGKRNETWLSIEEFLDVALVSWGASRWYCCLVLR